VKDFTILIIIVQLCDKEHHWKRMQWLIILSASFLALLSCYQMLSHNFDNIFYGLANSPVHEITSGFDSPRVSGPLSDPNYYGQILLTALPIAVYRLLTEDDRLRRVLGGVCSLLITAAMIFTYSRGSFIAVVVIGILIARERHFNLVKLTIGFTALLLILTPILPEGYLDRILTLQDVLPSNLSLQSERSFRGRSSEMTVAMKMFIDHPIIGLGLANYESHYLEYSALVGLDDRFEPREAHDLYLEIAAETGILGLLTFLGMLVAVISSLWRAKRRLARIKRADLIPWVSGVEYGLASYLVTSIFLHGSYIRYFWLIIALAVGCAVLVDTLTAQSQQASQTQIEELRDSPVRTPDNEMRVAST
jgi:O-antigen ligase